ncbi:MAG: hypothetical protein GY754_07755 [bacterium]|nr:hypothetical protein [bacterium]
MKLNKTIFIKITVFLLFIAAALSAQTLVLTFDNDPVGAMPKGFSNLLSGKGKIGNWVVIKEETAGSEKNVLAQTGMDTTGYRFPVCIYDGIKAKNATISVTFKPMKGTVDQAGGIVWRFIDKNNYYIARANALEDNVVTYIVKNGRRIDLPLVGKGKTYGKKVKVPAGIWSELKIVVRDDLFIIYLNNARLYSVKDKTFRKPGKMGLWTKADSYTLFNNLTIIVQK